MGYNSDMQTTTPRIGAVVLAGGSMPSSLAAYCTQRALLRVHDRLLLDLLLETLTHVPSIVETATVAPADTLSTLDVLPGVKVAAGETLVENMLRGARALDAQAPTHLLYVTGDIPLVTAEGLETFIRDSLNSAAALTYPIIPRAACERRFPGAHRTYARIKEGTFTGGNVILTRASLLDDKQALIQGLYQARKAPFKLAGILGMATVVRLLTGTLDLPYLEAVASRILDAPVRAIVTEHAEIGFDVDKAADLLAVEHALTRV
jgi:GTP:adenosylcobinamide-phosphate guanylyltransferase